MSKISPKRYREILDELSTEEGYCFFKEIMFFMHTDPRILIQMKCIEIHKWILSEREGREVDWEEAGTDWVDAGYAKVFGILYTDEETPKRLYNKIQKMIDNGE